MKSKKGFFARVAEGNWKDYFVQVSLIILSLFIATGVDRCRRASVDADKLNSYHAAIARDLEKEIALIESNLRDCGNDVSDLQRAMTLVSSTNNDSIEVALSRILRVISRGVFRTFEPSTFEVMIQSGDALLMNNIELRNDIAGAYAFREDYLQYDLREHDRRVLELSDRLGKYVDLRCLISSPKLKSCFIDREGFQQYAGSTVMVMWRHATLRAFHLEIAQGIFNDTLENLREEQAGD